MTIEEELHHLREENKVLREQLVQCDELMEFCSHSRLFVHAAQTRSAFVVGFASHPWWPFRPSLILDDLSSYYICLYPHVCACVCMRFCDILLIEGYFIYPLLLSLV